VFAWLRNRRRRQLLEQPFPVDWAAHLQKNVALYRFLPEPLRKRHCGLCRVFIAERRWEGCRGLTVTDEMRVTIAGHACLLVLGVQPDYYFDRVETILIYPDDICREEVVLGGLLVEEDVAIEGEYHRRGPVILSWQSVLREGRSLDDGRNVVLHEFAHHLDDLGDIYEDAPPLANREEARRWRQVIDAEYLRLARRAERGLPTLLGEDGATSKVEFFAVATECFFEQPSPLRRRHPELYQILSQFYQLDPADWQTWPAWREFPEPPDG